MDSANNRIGYEIVSDDDDASIRLWWKPPTHLNSEPTLETELVTADNRYHAIHLSNVDHFE
jgi:hypothetical protein